ncbi:hypothetical protein RD792_014172 [Penstemon davidsonii]|uniref:Uncharacterized protein n=1 Tax=Penstemon davidsonii TaxID=160366 RepID=A0ABR0CPF3_9LAMI|nr:hypothetical protein RD792_014172 [Penstemon davidsonii]
MTSESGDSLQSISVRLNGKNFSYWSYVMKNFLKGKKMWGYVTGIEVKPTTNYGADYAKLLDIWETNNSKVITWINNSVECSIGMQLAKYECANDVWDHLTKLYTQSNFAKRYQLEHDIRALEQNDLGIQEFYTLMSNLWDQLALTEPMDLRGNSSFITYREEQRLVQFLMALRNDFEGIRGSILHRSPLPSVDSVVSELLAEETRLKSHSGKGLLPSPSASVLAVPSRPPANNRNQPYVPTAPDECRFCKKKGHWKSQCPVLMRQKPLQQQQPQHQSQPPWRYGNQQRPNMNSRPNTAAVVPSSDSASFGGSPSSSSSMDSLAEQIQQIQKILAIQPHAMSAASTPHIGLSPPGPSGKSPSTWLLDSGASHHMSPDSTVFTVLHSKPYGSVTTADGTPMPLAGIGPIDTPNMSLDSVYHIPNLAMNLVSVGQLCDSGYSVSFSSTSCHVQDQQSKKLIGTGRRQGGLYVLDKLKAPAIAASSVDLSSFHLNSSSSPFYLWHSRLGHVSAPRLKYLVSSGALGSLKTTDISDCSGYNSENLSTDVPSTTDIDLSSSHSPAPVTSFPLHDHRRGQNVGTDNLDDSPPSTDAQPLPVIADPAHRYPHRIRHGQSNYDLSFKILLIGDSAVGKSSLLVTFISNSVEDLAPTIGVDFKIKLLTVGGKRLKLTIWDTVYDVTRRDTFTNLSDVWAKELELYSTNQDCVKMLVGNKVDRESERVVSREEGMALAKELGCIYLECSAKTRENVDQCFEELALKIMEVPRLLEEGSSTVVKRNILKQNQEQHQTPPGATCCS